MKPLINPLGAQPASSGYTTGHCAYHNMKPTPTKLPTLHELRLIRGADQRHPNAKIAHTVYCSDEEFAALIIHLSALRAAVHVKRMRRTTRVVTYRPAKALRRHTAE